MATAGICAALSLAVGMETLPYVAVAGLCVAASLLVGGRTHAALASGFGTASRRRRRSHSSPLFRPAPGCRRMRRLLHSAIRDRGDRRRRPRGRRRPRTAARRFATRLLALAGVGIAAAAAVLLFFPQCLAAPYATLDPRLKTFLLERDHRGATDLEHSAAQPGDGRQLLRDAGPGPSPAYLEDAARGADGARQSWFWHFLPQRLPSASGRSAARCSRYRWRRSRWPPGSASGGREWRRAAASPATLKMALAWIVSLNVVWSASANAIAGAVGAPLSPGATNRPAPATAPPTLRRWRRCRRPPCLRSPISARRSSTYTHHRVLAGPYHRNVAGDLLALQAFMGNEAEAAAIVEKNSIGLVVLCRGNDETGALDAMGAGRLPCCTCRRHRADLARKNTRRQRRTARNLPRRQAILTAGSTRGRCASRSLSAIISASSKYTCCDTFLKRFAAMVRSKAPWQGRKKNGHDVWRQPDRKGDFGSGFHRSADRPWQHAALLRQGRPPDQPSAPTTPRPSPSASSTSTASSRSTICSATGPATTY